MHSKATIRRWVSAVQEHTGLSATRILVLGFPQHNQQKRHCCTDQHECRKPTDANKTLQMASRFYLRPRLLCRLALWDRFTSSCFVVPQSPALESSLAPQIRHRFGAPTDPPPGDRRSRPYCVAGLLSLRSQLAATGCCRFSKWWARVLSRAISEHSNRNVLLPKPLGTTTVPLQEQRPATGEQRVRTT